MKEKWSAMSKKDKIAFLLKYVGGALFLIAGAVFGIVALSMFGWDFVSFIKNPTVDLVLLALLGIGITMLSFMEVK